MLTVPSGKLCPADTTRVETHCAVRSQRPERGGEAALTSRRGPWSSGVAASTLGVPCEAGARAAPRVPCVLGPRVRGSEHKCSTGTASVELAGRWGAVGPGAAQGRDSAQGVVSRRTWQGRCSCLAHPGKGARLRSLLWRQGLPGCPLPRQPAAREALAPWAWRCLAQWVPQRREVASRVRARDCVCF